MKYIQISATKTTHDGQIANEELNRTFDLVQKCLQDYEYKCIKAYIHLDTRIPFSPGDIYATVDCDNPAFKNEIETKLKSLGCK